MQISVAYRVSGLTAVWSYGHSKVISVDFGPDHDPMPLMTSSQGLFVDSASQLVCKDFDKTCRWRNGGHAANAVSAIARDQFTERLSQSTFEDLSSRFGKE